LSPVQTPAGFKPALSLLFVFLLCFCAAGFFSCGGGDGPGYIPSGLTPGSGGASSTYWARTVVAGPNKSIFYAVAVDGAAVYAAGEQYGTGSFDYGNGQTAAGTYSGENVVLVKYNASGAAQWAKTVTAGSGHSRFYAVAVDGAGNVYAAGDQGVGSFDYGNGQTAAGTGNVVLVKYNASGTAQWAKTVTGSGSSKFFAVAVDGAGHVYAAGYQGGAGSFDYGNGQTAAGTSSVNVVLVKYNASGTAQWAKTVAGSGSSEFSAVAVDGAGHVYAAGEQYGTGNSDYGSGNINGTFSGPNVVLVKYNASGTAQWAKTVTAGSEYSSFLAVAVDGAGNVYAAGYQYGTGSYNYGNGQTAAGTSIGNVVLVKYNASGTAQWAKSATGTNYSWFYAVAVDGAGNVYAAGYQYGTGPFDYGSGTVTGPSSGENVILVKYNAAGAAQWARTVTGSNSSMFYAVAADGAAVYAAGGQTGTGSFDYGNGQTAAGTSGANVVLVKYPRD
jgi:outer membrane protein assembly factor BamB